MKKEEGKEPIYDDLEPYCKWTHQASCFKEADLLEIHLRPQGFKKEELKLEMQKDGFLHISGEHPLRNYIKRFNKKIDVSKYETEEIETTYEDGIIRLKLPKKRRDIFRVCCDGRNNRTVAVLLRLDNQTLTKITIFLVALTAVASCIFLCTNILSAPYRNWF